ncbi:hypothetical protein B0T20DRAFT_370942 [Sordaria brevicollis]|uniref:Glycosyltransferase family 31 protein n=1 Tax=Sordaria brevicollis TaxID=83679 RepID=A0AAE0PID7_SORBR|nr:hypothetical protein B0T20DRAFT_370942 [Sordaria brevicollis]
MKMMSLRQRPARGFSVLVTLIFCVVLWGISRLRHHESLLPSTFDDWGGENRGGGEWKAQEKGVGGGATLATGATGGGGGKPTDQTTLQASQQQLPYRPKLDPGQCSKDIEFLRRPELGLTDNILYSRRCIKPVYKSDFDRSTITNVTGPLVTNTTALDLTSCSHDEPIPCEPLSLEVPTPYPKNAQYPHLLFGVASKYDRMREAIPAFAHWLSGTGARLVGTIADAVPLEHQDDTNRNSFNLTLLEEEYRAAGILATFLPPKIFKRLNLKDGKPDTRPVPVEHHHFLLIKELLSIVDSSSDSKEPHWLGILDDDTFFPSLHPLSQTLSHHRHTSPTWLGALSDDFMAVQAWGFMAFGGAGSFLSLPLARQLNPHLEECITTASIQTGDGILRDCIYSHTRTKLTLVEGLNQHDIKGDPSGFFESGVWPVLSLHHWKSWYEAPVEKMAGVVKRGGVCGDCFLMRVKFGVDDSSKDKKERMQKESLLSLGYSITTYPGLENGLDDVDLSRIEGTWNEADRKEKYAFSYGPVRRRLQEGREKKSWRLVDFTRTKKRFRQIYVHKAAGPAVGESMDEVIELVWEI